MTSVWRQFFCRVGDRTRQTSRSEFVKTFPSPFLSLHTRENKPHTIKTFVYRTVSTKEDIILVIIVPDELKAASWKEKRRMEKSFEKFWSTNSNKRNRMTRTTMENSIEEGRVRKRQDRIDHPSRIKLAAGRKPCSWNREITIFLTLALSMPSRTFLPSPLFSSSRRDEIYIPPPPSPLLTNRIREKIEREERVGSMYFRNVERSSTLGEGEGINPSPSREPDIWGGGEEIAESRYSSRALESIGGENWRGENGGGGPFERNLNASLFPPPFFLPTLLRS